jgi:4-aminobutyrate aminotransferase/4-aminobutyrate aminotransferase/(S)-3-amino-2-methylpropionate transaminase
LNKSFFVNSGSEANEGACLLAALATGRSELIALKGGLHGRTKLTMSLTGLGMWRTDTNPVGGISFLQSPHCLHCHRKRETCDLACADELEACIASTTSGRPAAFIAEPIQGNGGIVVPPVGYFRRIKEILDAHGALLILDEVQTGFGRTGKRFACEHEGVEPDILTLAKGLGNGIPIGAFITHDEVAARYTRPGASTTGGNAVSAAAGLAVLAFMEKENLPARAAELGERLKQRLDDMAGRCAGIAEVRGRGLMLGMELVDSRGAPDADRTDRILEALKDLGYLAGKTGPGRNVLTIMPTLVMDEGDLDGLAGALEEVLEK